MIKWIMLCFSLLSYSAIANTVDVIDLQESQRLGVKAEIVSEKPFSVKDEITLNIQVFTDRWFTKGTTIYIPKIKDAIVLKQGKFSSNATMKKNGKTYSVQNWELVIYPQKEGKFIIPSIPVNVTMSESTRNTVEGTLYTEPLEFDVIVSDRRMKEGLDWLSASDFKVSQELLAKDDLKVGDSITRKVYFESEGTVSMMLPILDLEGVQKVKSYVSSPKNQDLYSRGTNKSLKEQKVVYIIQEEGLINIPDLDVYWWNYETKTMTKITLDGASFKSKVTLKGWVKTNVVYIILSISFMFFAYAIKNRVFKVINYIWNIDSFRFYRTLCVKNYSLANKLNYKRLNEVSNIKSFNESDELDVLEVDKWNIAYKTKKGHNLINLYKIRKSINKLKQKKEKKRILNFD